MANKNIIYYAVRRGMRNLNDNKAIINIPIDEIAPNPYQPRKEFSGSSLEELAASIKAAMSWYPGKEGSGRQSLREWRSYLQL